METTELLTAIRNMVSFYPRTGEIFWKERGDPAWDARYAGKCAFSTKCKAGYLRGSFMGSEYYAHRVVFALSNNRWPIGDVDHIDGDRSNNSPSNLRQATRQQNLRNMKSKGRTSDYLGVSFDSARDKWTARVRIGGKPKSLGRFETEKDAAMAYNVAALKHYGEFANLNSIA